MADAAWTDPNLFADESHPDGHAAPDAERFITTLASQLGLPAGHVQAGYEDGVGLSCRRERQLPMNVDPFDARLEDEMERERLRRIFTQGLDASVGYALPIGDWAAAKDHGRRGVGFCAMNGSISSLVIRDGTAAADPPPAVVAS